MVACVAQPKFEEIGMSYIVTENFFDVHGVGIFLQILPFISETVWIGPWLLRNINWKSIATVFNLLMFVYYHQEDRKKSQVASDLERRDVKGQTVCEDLRTYAPAV